MAEAIYLLMIDVEERRRGSGQGFDTQLPLSVNDEWWLLVYLLVAMLTR
jgi:hypothetical protein